MNIAKLIHQKPYETQVMELRRHSLLLVKRVLAWLVLAAIPFGLYFFLRGNFPEILRHPVGFPTLVLAFGAYELSMWLVFFTMFLDYELDLWVVTNDRLVSMEQHGLFARTVAELDIWRVQDVTTDVRGVFPTFLNYGNVYVQSAGATARFALEDVPNPDAVRKFILEMADVDRKFHRDDIVVEHGAATSPPPPAVAV
ncbi:MAG: PH domain-containing protein [bacterium]|nr:PH domain-containing protein [bacterium]